MYNPLLIKCCSIFFLNLKSQENWNKMCCLKFFFSKVSPCCKKNPEAPCCTGNFTNSTETAPCPCDTCFSKLHSVILNSFSATGGLGLFFSFTEVSWWMIPLWLNFDFTHWCTGSSVSPQVKQYSKFFVHSSLFLTV